jgi:tetratricopeptide (TPR) repeat protein
VEAAKEPRAGATLQSRYRLDAELGRGGMGTVYRGHDLLLDRAVAIKFLSETGLGTEGRARLRIEARAVAKLDHPNIVRVYDAGEADDVPFVVMQLVEGSSLQARPHADLSEVLSIARQICAALEHAHAHGIVHRDLKPDNILILADGQPKLMDFGVARSVSSSLTTDGTIVGTAFYLSPEQALGRPIDGRTDLYALGVMLYQLVTGQLPFTGDDSLMVISQHLHAPVLSPRALRPDIPPALESIILKLLAKEPENRFASAREVATALSQAEVSAPLAPDPGPEATEAVEVLEHLRRGRLVGRRHELDQLRALWAHTHQGHGQLALISGEPGVGKTRLAQESIVIAQLRGSIVLRGGCYEYEASTPYLPFAEVLQGWVREQTSESLRQHLGGGVIELAKLAPEIESKLGALPPTPPLPPGQERLRLFDHVARFFRSLAGERGVLLFLDDLHWADQGTLALLSYLLRNLRNERLLVLATYREVELDRAHPLNAALLEWNRERLATRVALDRLSRADTGALLAVLLGRAQVPDAFVQEIYAETEGNPFFVEEVVKSLVEQGQIYREGGEWTRDAIRDLAIPQSVREAILRRLVRLSPACGEALQTAAALGKTFAFRELAALSTASEDQLLDLLDEAAAAQLIRSERDDKFTFTHEKLREILYEEWNPIRVRRLHLRIGQALEALYVGEDGDHRAGDAYDRLAFHYSRGEDEAKAIEYLEKAGLKAVDRYASPEALEYFRRAIELSKEGDTQGRILEARARLCLDLFRGKEATADYERLLDRARRGRDQPKELVALLGLGKAHYIVALDDPAWATRARESFQRASTLGRELNDRASTARALLATSLFVDFWPECKPQAAADAEEALALSREIQDEGLMLDSRKNRLPFLRLPECLHEGEALRTQLEARHDLVRLNELYFRMMWSYRFRGEFEKTIDCCDTATRVAKELGVAPVQYASIKALGLLYLGRYDESWASLQQEIADEDHPFGRLMRDWTIGIWYLEALAYEKSVEMFTHVIEEAKRLGRAWMERSARHYLAISLARSGRITDLPDGSGDGDFENETPGSASAFIPESGRIEMQLAQGALDDALRGAERAAAWAREYGRRPDEVAANELTCRILLRAGRPAEVAAFADPALLLAETMSYLPMVWRLRVARAQALVAIGEAQQATGEYQLASGVIEALARNIGDPALREQFLTNSRLAASQVASEHTPAPPRSEH